MARIPSGPPAETAPKRHVRRGGFSALCGFGSPAMLVEPDAVDPASPAADVCRRCLRRLIAKRAAARARRGRVEAPGTFRHWRRSDTVPSRPAEPAVEVRGVEVGERFGVWRVLRLAWVEGGHQRVTVRCEGTAGHPCGVERVVRADKLTTGVSTSCGCARVTGGAKAGRGA